MLYAFQIESVLEGAEDAMHLLVPSLPIESAKKILAGEDATKHELKLVQGSEAIAVYFASTGLKDFARSYDLTTDQAKTLLDRLGVGFSKSAQEQRARGRSLREIAATHGIQPSKLSRWMKEDGFEVKRGNHATIEEKKLVAVYRKTNSGQKAADAVGVSWSTAIERLKRLDEWKG